MLQRTHHVALLDASALVQQQLRARQVACDARMASMRGSSFGLRAAGGANLCMHHRPHIRARGRTAAGSEDEGRIAAVI